MTIKFAGAKITIKFTGAEMTRYAALLDLIRKAEKNRASGPKPSQNLALLRLSDWKRIVAARVEIVSNQVIKHEIPWNNEYLELNRNLQREESEAADNQAWTDASAKRFFKEESEGQDE
jgi:hypothetical protein